MLTSLFSLNTKWKAFNNVKSLGQIKQNGSLYTITMHLQICYKKLQITAKSFRKYNTLAQKHCFLLSLFKQTSHNPCSRKGKKIEWVTSKFISSNQFWCDGLQSNFHQEGQCTGKHYTAYIFSWSSASWKFPHFSWPLCISSLTTHQWLFSSPLMGKCGPTFARQSSGGIFCLCLLFALFLVGVVLTSSCLNSSMSLFLLPLPLWGILYPSKM